jgi:hypothetical protein
MVGGTMKVSDIVFENGEIGGYLSSADVEVFQRFEKSLEQQLQEAEIQKSQTP